jgi:hypothetical protein
MGETSVTEVEFLIEAEDERVVNWRIEELLRAGYEEFDALDLALDRNVDLHRAVALLRSGCPSKLAVQILL